MFWEIVELVGISSYSGNVGRAPAIESILLTSSSTYQEFLVKNLGHKCASQNVQMDKVVNQANTEIANLRNQLSSK
jgi:E3 ubiquitin-protein ligase CCNP1IP1